jgi:hypothetical protein
MATQTLQSLYTSLPEMTYNLCKKQVNETVWEKTMEKNFQTKKSIIFIIIINDNTM